VEAESSNLSGPTHSDIVTEVKTLVFSEDIKAWNLLWKWEWFLRDNWKSTWRGELKKFRAGMKVLLSDLKPKTILDVGCGIGLKTTLIAELGYNVEGTDGSTNAIKYALKFTKEQGVKVKFFQSMFKDLGKKSKRKYDMVWSDQFDWIRDPKSLKDAAKGIYSVLNDDGKFVFWTCITKKELKQSIDKLIKREGRVGAYPPLVKKGIKVMELEIKERIKEGVIENRIFIIEEKGKVRIEIARIFDIYKWILKDIVKLLKDVGFKRVYRREIKGERFIIAVK
jgi:SAM-dependent methyltransferase